VPTGFKDIDDMTAGLQPADLIIIAGRPSMGKTALALNIALNAAFKHKVPVAVFSLEMSKEQLVMRCLPPRPDRVNRIRAGRSGPTNGKS
jgi:replicative DNA helicase